MSTSPDAPAVAASLQLRRVAIDTYRENVAYLHRDCAVYRAEGFQALSKVEVRANGHRILGSVGRRLCPARRGQRPSGEHLAG